ncbi:cytochrome P450 [Nocardia sp. NPDC024068]|uniref:cytochrome P450 n=1 Tax=Nocardia sp. NPDC024068 TaxID=3157197 RepID=UPI0034020D27
MSEYESVDYFTDPALIPDPYPYFDHLRDRAPVLPDGPGGVVTITGHAEALAAYRDTAFSSCNAVVGPFAPLPFTPEGDDITELIELHRDGIPMAEHVVTMDADRHLRTRGLLSTLLTPKRLSENEGFMWKLADEQIDTFLGAGRVEFLSGYAKPFSMLVIADLLGVPADDHREFRAVLGDQLVGELDGELAHNPLEWLDDKFRGYISERRDEPRPDVLTALAQAKYSDATIPTVEEVVKLATFLFAAGQETTTKLLSAAVRNLAEYPDTQAQVRADRHLVPTFLEETLRLESPVKSHFRMARTSTEISGCPIEAGTTVMLLPGASNRDPRKFPDPGRLDVDRRNAREHIAFGRGAHSCPGAPLARAEARISINRLLDRLTGLRIDEAQHGSRDARNYDYEPTFVMRGLSKLYVEFDPVR